MKNYTITVNGNVYDVTVEEKTGAGTLQRPSTPAAPVAAAAPAAKTEPALQKASTGGIEVKAGAAGKVFKIEKAAGEQVKKGDAVVIIEAMKMEIPVVAPEDGTVAQIEVTVGDAVEAGAVLATLDPA
ncbi:biotin/lipoyl-containing protein [Suipraeoptans intestinalis]|uniref:biotin/lipoyl-containing protein n=1 Tax=Suipraeoptans intestinalis TaxID=2606628 RepID=UPI0023F43BF6|nr:biotin/lipoyl-containing protein [Suipraeoptans intestinalis]MDD7770746.1 biotin/lipoyl-binding protein [Suipraeoptans intestinalis]MDY3122268.1 biotin/lipoyl-containing protein [Suipraeoptans intestinalis]